MIKVYFSTIDGFGIGQDFLNRYAKMPDYRKQKIDGTKDPIDKRLSLGAGVLLNYALKEEGITSHDVVVGENGKPYLKDGNLHFNLSHSGDMVACAISNGEVGCDVQEKRAVNLELAKRYFCPSEVEYIFANGKGDVEDRFFRTWAVKESFIKAVGLGIGLKLNGFCVEFLRDKIEVVQDIFKDKFYFKDFDLAGGYKLAVCGKEKEFEFIQVNLTKI
ncbi:MAG: 4'-phosphopantetheinyl transferase superfamily protein [Clostridiales bacterium]|nr:4'-phosphopantetheinyl transferase superfamily protein [Clostridiales bacterium]